MSNQSNITDIAKSLDIVFPPLASALASIDRALSDLSPFDLISVLKMTSRIEGTEAEMQAAELVEKAAELKLASHLAKNAKSFSVLVDQTETGQWAVRLAGIDDDMRHEAEILHQTYASYAEAKAAGDTLKTFLRLSRYCHYEWQVPNDERPVASPIPF